MPEINIPYDYYGLARTLENACNVNGVEYVPLNSLDMNMPTHDGKGALIAILNNSMSGYAFNVSTPGRFDDVKGQLRRGLYFDAPMLYVPAGAYEQVVDVLSKNPKIQNLDEVRQELRIRARK